MSLEKRYTSVNCSGPSWRLKEGCWSSRCPATPAAPKPEEQEQGSSCTVPQDSPGKIPLAMMPTAKKTQTIKTAFK